MSETACVNVCDQVKIYHLLTDFRILNSDLLSQDYSSKAAHTSTLSQQLQTFRLVSSNQTISLACFRYLMNPELKTFFLNFIFRCFMLTLWPKRAVYVYANVIAMMHDSSKFQTLSSITGENQTPIEVEFHCKTWLLFTDRELRISGEMLYGSKMVKGFEVRDFPPKIGFHHFHFFMYHLWGRWRLRKKFGLPVIFYPKFIRLTKLPLLNASTQVVWLKVDGK